MSLNKMKRTLGAVALAVAFFLAAVPARAAGEPAGAFDRLVASAVDGLDDWLRSVWADMVANPGGPLDGEGGFIDPNGGPKPGCESTPEGCNPGGGSN